jgi:hypothetical protein
MFVSLVADQLGAAGISAGGWKVPEDSGSWIKVCRSSADMGRAK